MEERQISIQSAYGQFKSGELLIRSWENPHLLGMVFIYLGVLDVS